MVDLYPLCIMILELLMDIGLLGTLFLFFCLWTGFNFRYLPRLGH